MHLYSKALFFFLSLTKTKDFFRPILKKKISR